jgi:hypothetical protein
MLSTLYPVEFRDTHQEIEALFRVARQEDVEKGGHYDARYSTIHLWSHHWLHAATKEESDILGTFHFRWGETSLVWLIEVDQGFSLDDLLQALGRLERKAFGVAKHGDVPRDEAVP